MHADSGRDDPAGLDVGRVCGKADTPEFQGPLFLAPGQPVLGMPSNAYF